MDASMSHFRRIARAVVIFSSLACALAVCGCNGKGTNTDGGSGTGGQGAMGGMSSGGNGGGGGGTSGGGGSGGGGTGGNGCPVAQPTPSGACSPVGLQCVYAATTCSCVHPATQNANYWTCGPTN